MAHRGTENLKRGQKKASDRGAPIPQPHGGAIAAPGGDNGANLLRGIEEDRRIKNQVLADPDKALEEIHAALTVWTTKIVKRGARTSTPPDSATMNVIREFRQTQEAVNEARRAKGAIVEAREFFDTVDERVATLARLSPEPLPVAELS
jgi:hypothetical protein